MIEKTRTDDAASREAVPDAETAPEPGEIKACIGATGGGEGTAPGLSEEDIERLKSELIAAIKTVFDPEIPVDIYELGLIYRLDVDPDRNVEIDMTLTAPGCPVAGDMPGWVENAASAVPGVGQVKVNLVFDPPWDMSRMSDAARLDLNMF
ncbi:MAG: SUF system Fe-S cluster assembly protein [Methyloceanibacter sp.]